MSQHARQPWHSLPLAQCFLMASAIMSLTVVDMISAMSMITRIGCSKAASDSHEHACRREQMQSNPLMRWLPSWQQMKHTNAMDPGRPPVFLGCLHAHSKFKCAAHNQAPCMLPSFCLLFHGLLKRHSDDQSQRHNVWLSAMKPFCLDRVGVYQTDIATSDVKITQGILHPSHPPAHLESNFPFKQCPKNMTDVMVCGRSGHRGMLGALLGPGASADKEISPNRIAISQKDGEPWKLGSGAFGQVGCPYVCLVFQNKLSELICQECSKPGSLDSGYLYVWL